MSRNSPSMKTAARRGHQPFSHCLVPGNVVADTWQTYAAAALEAGRQPKRADWKVARSIFLADTTQEAVRRRRISDPEEQTLRRLARVPPDAGERGVRREHVLAVLQVENGEVPALVVGVGTRQPDADMAIRDAVPRLREPVDLQVARDRRDPSGCAAGLRLPQRPRRR